MIRNKWLLPILYLEANSGLVEDHTALLPALILPVLPAPEAGPGDGKETWAVRHVLRGGGGDVWPGFQAI